jgi:hypothetical protein
VERIEKPLDGGWLQVARLSSREKNTANSIVSKGGIDAGEARSIALASSRKRMVIIDDRAARSFAVLFDDNGVASKVRIDQLGIHLKNPVCIESLGPSGFCNG